MCANYQQPVRKVAPRLKGQRTAPNPQLFEDTSMQQNAYGYSQSVDYRPADQMYDSGSGSYDNSQHHHPPAYGGGHTAPFYGQPLLSDPMANMAVQYGQSLAGQGTEIIHKNIEKYVATSRLKYYFAVDTSYVGKKLGLLMFPFVNSDWSLRYNPEEPVQPRYDTNAPDLYIPVMSFVTYILLAGIALGTQNKFTPEHLGMTASTALVWTAIEILLLILTMYIMNIPTNLKSLDILSYCGYKYFGMIVILVMSLLLDSTGYYIALAWMSASIGFFLVRSLRIALMSQGEGEESFSRGGKRRLYMLLVIAASQPVLMWWLTRRLTG